jgi:hypothetical protein
MSNHTRLTALEIDHAWRNRQELEMFLGQSVAMCG